MKVRIVLNVERRIRDRVYKPGTVILEGESSKNFSVADVDKAIKNQEVTVQVVDTEVKKEK